MMAWKSAQKVRKRAAEDPVVRLGTDIQKKISEGLIDFFDDIVKQGVPDRFIELLKRLDDPVDQGEHGGDAGKFKLSDDSNEEGK